MEKTTQHLSCAEPELLWKSVTFSAVDQELQSVVVSLQTTVNCKIIVSKLKILYFQMNKHVHV